MLSPRDQLIREHKEKMAALEEQLKEMNASHQKQKEDAD